MRTTAFIIMGTLAFTSAVSSTEFHVATNGNDTNPGTRRAPLRTIQRAADLAQPGDVITVRHGVYRERINPPRGGSSDKQRIVYQAARGEHVEIKGSEVLKSWVKVQDDVWKASLPNSFFGDFNPYQDPIRGDWFNGRGRAHHTGAVYLNGEWLIEAAKLEEVLMPAGETPAWLGETGSQYLLNVAWLRPEAAGGESPRIPATGFATQNGVQAAPCSEGGECIGWIEHGDWARYERVDLGQRTEHLEIRVASASEGGVIEVRLESAKGELLGTCPVRNTGDWQSWALVKARIKPVSGIKNVCLLFKSAKPVVSPSPSLRQALWFAQVEGSETTIWAQFKGVNPNEQLVEINVRRTVFYPDKPGRNYLTVRGFTMRQAATPWAPPTAEQPGLIGTHWSKGWIIENNLISHSVCSGIALGKHGDEFDNTSADTAEGYVKTIERAHAHAIPWTKENIGHHVVRNNTISHCEQTGIVGSLGAAFSQVTGNVIHDIHVRRLFTGAEMAGIKFHAAIDTTIRSNHIYRTCRGLWLDWMAQGTRVTQNFFHDNAAEDLFVEVNHGPFLVDNNLFLSPTSLLDMSEGGAYAHNLFAGKLYSRPELSRDTPYHASHSTKVAGLVNIKGGDNRFFNNVFLGQGETGLVPTGKASQGASGFGLWLYDAREFSSQAAGNVYANGARPYARETNAVVLAGAVSRPELLETGDGVTLRLQLDDEMKKAATVLVDSERLGRAVIPGLGYENADGSPLVVDKDYFGQRRSRSNPSPGPFESPGAGRIQLKVW
jgi:hypothetical protein